MSVYVDDALREAAVRNGSRHIRGRWSHLFADSAGELRAAAARLGLQADWIRASGTPAEHFAVTASKRLLALRMGAVRITEDEGTHLLAARRAGVDFDLQLLRTDPATVTTTLHQHQALLHRLPSPEGPRRLQLSRSRGARLPEGAVSVAAPTRWANPYRPAARTPAANTAAVEHFRAYLARNPRLIQQARTELAGLDLACWCPPDLPCHADVWLVIANDNSPERPT